jgi:hypothetical protein
MNLDEYIEWRKGKYIDRDGMYGYQCMDLWREYVAMVLKLPQSAGVLSAADVWSHYLIEHYDRIPYAPGLYPAKGDIVIWDYSEDLPDGHIAISTASDPAHPVCFSQRPNKPDIVEYPSYVGVLGWIRPKKAKAEEVRQEKRDIEKGYRDMQTIGNVMNVPACPNCGVIGGTSICVVDGEVKVIACKCGYNAPGMAVAGTPDAYSKREQDMLDRQRYLEGIIVQLRDKAENYRSALEDIAKAETLTGAAAIAFAALEPV